MTRMVSRQPTNEIFLQTSFLDSGNAMYIENLQARCHEDPSSVVRSGARFSVRWETTRKP